MTIPESELLKIALAHAKSGAKFMYDEDEIPIIRDGYKTDMIGLFVPVSSYYSTKKIEELTTFEMRDCGIFDDNDLRFIHVMDKVNIETDDIWVELIEEKINGECQANSGQ